MQRTCKARQLTRVEPIGDGVEHVSVHVGVDSPVLRGVIAGSDEDRVPLGDGYSKEINRALLGVDLAWTNLSFISKDGGKKQHLHRRPR